MYNGPSVGPFAFALVTFRLYTVKCLDSPLIYMERMYLIQNMRYLTIKLMQKEISSEMYKHLTQQKVQQLVQQKVHDNHVTFLLKRNVFPKLEESLC